MMEALKNNDFMIAFMVGDIGRYMAFYYFILNVILYILMFVDKQKARHNKWRIRERTLFTFSALGGFIGGFLAMKIHRHKNRKPIFYIVFMLSLFLHLALIIYFIHIVN